LPCPLYCCTRPYEFCGASQISLLGRVILAMVRAG
jgi:hypothetical protein